MSRAIDDGCSTTDRGLNYCVNAPAIVSVSSVCAEDSSRQGCHLPTCARVQSGSHGCASLLSVATRCVWDRCCVAPKLVQLGDFPSEVRHPAHHVTRPLRTTLSERQCLDSRLGFRRIAGQDSFVKTPMQERFAVVDRMA